MNERIEKINELLKKMPADSFLKHALALEYIKIGNDAQARALFEEILSRDENFVGSYYHLGRLLERNNENKLAIKWYEKGMQVAKEANEMRTYNELQNAYEDLI